MAQTALPVNDKREIFGWAMYDWANSAFSTTVGTVFLGPYVASLAGDAAKALGHYEDLIREFPGWDRKPQTYLAIARCLQDLGRFPEGVAVVRKVMAEFPRDPSYPFFLENLFLPQSPVFFVAMLLAMLAVDLGVFNRKAHTVSAKEAGIWTAVWIGLALAFNVGIYFWRGSEPALQFLTGCRIRPALASAESIIQAIDRNYGMPAVAQETLDITLDEILEPITREERRQVKLSQAYTQNRFFRKQPERFLVGLHRQRLVNRAKIPAEARPPGVNQPAVHIG